VGWAGLSPKKVGPISAQRISLFSLGQIWPRHKGWARISLAHKHIRAGPEPAWPSEGNPISAGPAPAWPSIKNPTEGGNYFPPPILLHADRMFCMQEETQVTKEMQGGEEFTWRGGGGALLVGLLRWRCCGGDRWLCRGSRTATPSNGYCFKRRCYCFSVVSLLSSRFCFLKKLPSPVSSFPLLFPFSLYFISLFGSFSPPFGWFCFLLCFRFFFSMFFLFVLPASFFFSPLSPRVLALCWSIYRVKGSGGVPIATL
jgi:hypothetical protein